VELQVSRMKQKQILTAIAVATFAAFLGWIGLRHVTYIAAVPGLWILLATVAMPGILIEVLLEAAFSPQGFHDGVTFAWIVTPANLALYFAFSVLLMKIFKGPSHSRS